MNESHSVPATDRSTPIASWSTRALGMVACCLLVGLGAQLRIPVPGTDVPVTLQTLAVLLTGFALPANWAAASMVLYLACGTAGFPVFSPGSAGVAGMTGGYLVGFVAAAWTVGRLKGAGDSGPARLMVAATAGTAVIFCFGVAWRVVYWWGDVPLALMTGFDPFVLKEIIVTMTAATLAWSLRLMKRS